MSRAAMWRACVALGLACAVWCVAPQGVVAQPNAPEGPVDEGPIDEGPIDEGPVDEGPVDEGPIDDEGPVDEGPVDEGPIDEGPADEDPKENPQGGDEADPNALVKLPKLKTFVDAAYPERALSEGVEAVVVLEIDVGADGKVEAVRVSKAAEALGYGFDEAALKAAEQFVFEPAEDRRGPVPVRITYTYGFKLDAKPPEAEVPDGSTPQDEAAPGVVNFQGRLLERGTRTPMVGVVVTVFRGEGEDAEGYDAVSDEEGRFAFVGLTPDVWKVYIQPQGYFPVRTTEEVRADEVVDVEYFIERGRYNPLDVLVEAPRPKKVVTRRVLRRAEIEKVPGNFGDPVKVVRTLPGVARSFFGSPAIIVRGSSPEDTRTYVNGVLVPLIYHFGGLRSIVPLGLVESIQFYPGNMSVRYGQSIGGVLDVELKRLRLEETHGYVDINAFDAGVYLETPLGDDASLVVSGRRSYIDALLTWAVPDDAPVDLISAPRYYDYQTMLSWRPTPSQELRLLVFGSDDELKALFDNPKDTNVQLQSGDFQAATAFNRVMVDHRWVPSESVENTLMVAVGQDVVDASLGDQFFAQVNLLQFSGREQVRWKLAPTTTLTVGADVTWGLLDVNIRAPRPRKEGDAQRFNSRDLEESTTEVRAEADPAGGAAAFFELELEAWEDLMVIPGVRVEHIEPVKAQVFEPRLTVRYTLSPQWVIKGGVGLFHQPPLPDETAEGFGNPDLGPERAVHYALGAEWRPLEHLSLDVTGFYKDLDQLVSRTNATSLEPGADAATAVNFNNLGEGRVYGVEILAKHDFANNFLGWITYTLSRAERLDFGETEYRLFDFDQTHILTVIGSYQFESNWTASLSWRLTSGNPDTPVLGGVFDADDDRYYRILGAANSVRLPAFHQLDIRVDKTWIYDTWTFNLYLDIQNVYNQTNTNFFQYNYDLTMRQPQQGLPVLPIVGVKSEF